MKFFKCDVCKKQQDRQIVMNPVWDIDLDGSLALNLDIEDLCPECLRRLRVLIHAWDAVVEVFAPLFEEE